MCIELTLPHGANIEFEPGLPADFRGPVMPGATAKSAKTKILEIVVQEFKGEDYSIRFWVCHILKNLTLRGKFTNTGLHTFFNLLNDVRREVESVGKMHLRKEQYACFITESSTCKATFHRNTEYRSFDFYYSPKLLDEFLNLYPEIKSIIGSPSGRSKFRTLRWSTPAMRELIDQFLNCQYNEPLSRLFMDLKVRELLLQVIRNEYKIIEEDFHFTIQEKARLQIARNILEDHISSKPPTIRELAKMVALNEFKIKTGFRQLFDTGIFEYILDKKMQHARSLLLNTDKPVKEICRMVGYTRTTNFITAFRKRFGITPGTLRRK